MKLTGLKFTVNRSTLKQLKNACEAGAYAAGKVLAERSREQVPVATGRLKGTCRVEKTGHTASVLYGTDYAVYVHERTWVSHPNGKAKFLEDPAHDGGVQKEMLEAAGAVVKEAVG